jgi:hypothetical protein
VETALTITAGLHGHDRAWLYTQSTQSWDSVDGRKAGVARQVQLGEKRLPWGPAPQPMGGSGAGWYRDPGYRCGPPPRGTYAFLAGLPTVPSRLRAWIYRHREGQQQADQEAWADIIEFLRGQLMPSKLAAAFFRVAATIPGTTVIQGATDAIGRRGTAVSLYIPSEQADDQLIFSRTFQLLGQREVLAAPVKGEGPAGTVIDVSAQRGAKVVDHLPPTPASITHTTDPCGDGLQPVRNLKGVIKHNK